MSHRYKAKRRQRYYEWKLLKRRASEMIRAGEALLAYEPSKVKETPEQTKMRRAFVRSVMFGIPIPEEVEPEPTTRECFECGHDYLIEEGCNCQVSQGYDEDDRAKDERIEKMGDSL